MGGEVSNLKLTDRHFFLLDALMRDKCYPMIIAGMGGKSGSWHANLLMTLGGNGLVQSRRVGRNVYYFITEKGGDIAMNFRRGPLRRTPGAPAAVVDEGMVQRALDAWDRLEDMATAEFGEGAFNLHRRQAMRAALEGAIAAPRTAIAPDVRKALELARDTFDKYAQLHMDKETVEATKKAIANQLLASEMRKALGEKL